MTTKLFVVGILLLLLLIPAAMVSSLIHERERLSAGVVHELSEKWGGEQTVTGPLLVIPYKEYFRDDKGERKFHLRTAYLLPDTLEVETDADPHLRNRGIYQAVLYDARVALSGRFSYRRLADLNIDAENVIWSDLRIELGISEMKGIHDRVDAVVDGKPLAADPGVRPGGPLAAGISARVPEPDRSGLEFRYALNLHGSQWLGFVPVGETTTAAMRSPWASPKFDGAFLPSERRVGADGFAATWKVLHLNRDFPQAWTEGSYRLGAAAFGTRLIVAADIYQQATRTAKYAAMFLVFTFGAFFFSEVLSRSRVHPVQYLMIGGALVLFYSLLIAFAEHIGFTPAYLLASGATVGLITAYTKSILRSTRLAATVGALIAMLYVYLYMVLRLEDYALLVGSVGLFLALAAAMYLTRRIDWYGVNLAEPAAP